MTTQGKWEFSTGDPDKRNYGIYSVEGGRIAEVLNQNEANANLIAAAPDLLAACKAIKEGIRHIDGQLPEQMKQPYRQLLTAIQQVGGLVSFIND